MSVAVAERQPHMDLFAEGQYIPANPERPVRPQASDPAFQYVLDKISEFEKAYRELITREQITLEKRFRALFQAWKAETGNLSSITQVAIHPAYQQIIGIGLQAVPLILKELERAPDHWFWALRAVTGENPVPAEHRGRMEEMRRAWIQWGRERRFLT